MSDIVEHLRMACNEYGYCDGSLAGDAADEIERLRAELAQRGEPVAAAVPPGWRVVPVEPTGEMTGAMQDAALANYDATINHELAGGPEPEGWCRAVYRAMLAAAPEVPRRKPLSVKQAETIIYEHTRLNPNLCDDRELVGYIVNAIRAVERAHGITESTHNEDVSP